MSYSKLLVPTLAAAALLMAAPALAQRGNSAEHIPATVGASATANVDASTSLPGNHASATGTQERAMNTNDQAQVGDHGQGAEHRSFVANMVLQLKHIAGLLSSSTSAEVNAVADDQASTSEVAANAMDKTDSESWVKKFILGPDYKSLGQLRSTVVTTQNDINRLQRTLASTSDPAAQIQLSAQIGALEKVASDTQAYITAHESGFSLFGWLAKYFQ